MTNENKKKSALPEGQTLDLSTLVEYGLGAVVSRTILETETGTVTLFAFDQGQGLSEHTAPFDALVQVFEGKGEFIIGGQANQVGAGQMILMPANIPHALRALERFKMMLIMLRR